MITSLQFSDVAEVVAQTLAIPEQAAEWTPETELFGHIAELDSLAVVEVVAALENRFGITVDPDELTIDVFATFGALADFVQAGMADTTR